MVGKGLCSRLEHGCAFEHHPKKLSDHSKGIVESSQTPLHVVGVNSKSPYGAAHGDTVLVADRVMDTVGSLVIVLGPNGRIRRTNLRCRQALEGPQHELLGKVLDALLPEEERSALDEQLPQLPWPVLSPLFETIRRQGEYNAEHRLRGHDGSYRYYQE